jgi:tetratricopeptide (TPR) repeat protein
VKAIRCFITSKSVTINDATAAIEPSLSERSVKEFSDEMDLVRDLSKQPHERKNKEIERRIMGMGRKLFRRVFTEAALDQYRSADPAALALLVSDDLAILPWELLHDGANWTARTRGVVRAVTAEQRPPEIIPKPGALRVLAAIAGPLLHDNEALPDDDPRQPDPIDVNAHAEVFRRLEGAQFPAEVKLRKHITRESLSREVSENYHVLHFVGHGNVGRLVFENRHGIADLAEEDWIREQITVALRGGLRLVVVNSCFSADADKEMPGVAATILKTGVPAVIGMRGSVSEPADIAFVRNLYGGLARGKPIDEAVMDARRAMATDPRTEAWEWATPVLFVNESLLDEKVSLNLMDAEMAGMMAAPKVNIFPPEPSLDPMMTRDERFVGRRRELSDVLRSLDPERQDGAQMACLHGDAGMGKTAIAIEAAHRIAEWFDDVIWLSGRTAPPDELREHVKGDDPLARISGAEGLLMALAHKCGFDLKGDEEPSQLRDGILRNLRDGGRKLLVLDSMERFVRSDLIRSLLVNLPANCKALITSRESLEMDERPVPVKSMNNLDSARLLIEYSGLKDLKIDSEEIGGIIHRTDGHPMAMRMVVSQVVTAQKTLGDALKDLREARGEIFDYIFKRSLRLAGSDGRKVFAAMAVFLPTASRKALQHVCGLNDADFEKTIKRVVGLSLVESYEQGKRFGLHQLARAKAQQELGSDKDGGKYRERAARFFMEFVNATAPMTQPAIATKALMEQMPGSALGKQMIQDAAIQIFVKPAMEDLETELANCLLALEWWLDRGGLDTATKFLDGLGEFLIMRGYWDEAIYYNMRMAEGCRNRGAHHAEAAVLINLGTLYYSRGRWKDSIEHFENALRIAREFQNKALEGEALAGLGTVYAGQRKWDEAGRCLEASREMFQILGDELGKANVINRLGALYLQTGRWDEAARCFEDFLRISERHDDKRNEAAALANLGLCHWNGQRYDSASKCYEGALRMYEDLGNKAEKGDVLNNLGLLHQSQGDLEGAVTCYQASLEIKREIGDRVGQSTVLGNIVIVHSRQHQWLKAANSCLESFQIAVQIQSTVVMDSLRNILDVSKNILRAGEFAIPAQLVQQLSQLTQSAEVSDEEMRMALAICHGVFTIIGFMAMCECDKRSDAYKEALELARSLDENTGAALKLVEWLKGDEANGAR